MSNDIQNREDVYTLVSAFYAKVRKDEHLGNIFNTIIHEWDTHLEHLTDFWESQLFMVNKFSGNPIKKHVVVDQKVNNTITEKHFGYWMQLWFTTIDELFEGEKAQLAKNKARNMGTYMYLEIFKQRSEVKN